MKNGKTTERHIEELLARFMDGVTTLDEEEQLAIYFRGNKVKAEWADYKEMFACFDRGMADVQPKPVFRLPWRAMAVAASVALLCVMAFSLLDAGSKPSAGADRRNVAKAASVKVLAVTPEAPAVCPPASPSARPARAVRPAPRLTAEDEDYRMRTEIARIDNEAAEAYSRMLVEDYMISQAVEAELNGAQGEKGDCEGCAVPNKNIMTLIMQ